MAVTKKATTVMTTLVPMVVTNVGTAPLVVKAAGIVDKTLAPSRSVDTHVAQVAA